MKKTLAVLALVVSTVLGAGAVAFADDDPNGGGGGGTPTGEPTPTPTPTGGSTPGAMIDRGISLSR